MKCPRCNAENADHARFCANCGQPLTPQTASLSPLPFTTAPAPTTAPTATPPDANIAFVLELLLGLIGFMGVGWMYSGQIMVGVLLLVGWWVTMALGGGLSFFTLGLGCCIWIPVQLVAPFISALVLRNQFQQLNPFRNTFPQ